MKTPTSAFYKTPVKFRIPTADNFVPIRLDIEIDGQRYKDAFTWNPSDPDSEVVVFAKRTVKDLKLPPAFVTQIAQSIQVTRSYKTTFPCHSHFPIPCDTLLIFSTFSDVSFYKCSLLKPSVEYTFHFCYQSQLAEFRSYEGQDMYTGEKIVPIKLDLRVNHTLIKDQFLWDLNNFESDPEELARNFCKDMGIEDPEVGPAIAFAIREQLYEIAIQSVVSARESRMNKKGRRGFEYTPVSKAGTTAVDLVKLFGQKSSVVRKRKEWDVYEPIVDLLSNEEVDALEAKEERNFR